MPDAVTEYVVSRVDSWSIQRDTEYTDRWGEYYRMWRGIWDPVDRDRASERSRAIMPALQQAVESAVAEMVEATFGRERWFDAQDPIHQDLADQLLRDLWPMRSAFAEIFLMGALYGTGIGKIVITSERPFEQRIVPLEPWEFVIDPGARTIGEAHAVAHVIYTPMHIIERRQKDGLYASVDMTSSRADLAKQHRHTREQMPQQSDLVRLVEWHGLVPATMIPDAQREDGIGDDDLVESIVTIANDEIVLRTDVNTMDRGFVAYQHDSVPRRFWGRGLAEKGYWPQKVLDSEIRARTDALAFSTHPMMALNASVVPRGERFAVRPGRNVFLNGEIPGNIAPIQFPPPDPQTYQQARDMERMVELGTGQLQATAQAIDTRNAPASGISMIFGAQVRRTKRTLSNVERDFLDPVIRKLAERYIEFDRRYSQFRQLPDDFKPRFHGTLGFMAREFELQQLGQILAVIQPGPAQTAIVRLMLENSALSDKSEILDLMTMVQEQQLSQGEQDLSGQARMIAAISRAEEGAQRLQLEVHKLQQKQHETASLNAEREREHQRELIQLSLGAQKEESEILVDQSKALLNVAQAEAAELGSQLEGYRAFLESLETRNSQLSQEADQREEQTDVDIEGALRPILQQIKALEGRLAAAEEQPKGNGGAGGPISVERDDRGLVQRINGRSVTRDNNGLIAGVE